jgi:hypothetical protein
MVTERRICRPGAGAGDLPLEARNQHAGDAFLGEYEIAFVRAGGIVRVLIAVLP